MKLKILLFLIICYSCSTISQERWVQYYYEDPLTFYYDKETIKIIDNKIFVWEKLISKYEMKDTETGKIIDYELIKFEFNENDQYRILDWIEYFKDGTKLGDNYTRPYIYIKPETRFEKLYNQIKGYVNK